MNVCSHWQIQPFFALQAHLRNEAFHFNKVYITTVDSS